ncbi:hypothetical protein [Spirosoma aerolatum]|uniref:hypothetical protein n=1 Tax=Spirosoma aerolatum TaxID=1211326 RepID=UPI0009ADD369|nr:hypothetical protein [Spirosoma aerolatum]
MSRGIRLLLVVIALIALSWAVYECKYYYSYYTDLTARPWAYNRDENAPLLVGTWQGEFRDPDNVAKTIRLTIEPPVSEEERSRKAARRTRKRSSFSRTDKKWFGGEANITSVRGKEEYSLSGHVRTDDGHQLGSVRFSTEDGIGPIRSNFNLQSASDGGTWQGDELTLTIGFTYITQTGASHWSSADPRYDKKVTIHFSRIKP